MYRIFACFCLLLTMPAHANFVDESCEAGHPFAHCSDEARDFHSVVLAIHGWTGSCSSTFGDRKDSLFYILDQRRF